MRHILLLTLLPFLSLLLFAQDDNKQKINDTFSEMEDSALTLRFFDALSGSPIQDAVVIIGDQGSFTTDFNGRAIFTSQEDNGILKIKFTHPKYITSEFEIEIMAGTLFFNRFSVSPKMPIGAMRIVLDWGDKPSDLDAHLVKNDDYHISFRNMKEAKDGTAKLDRDAQQGYGPETITINNVSDAGSYTYFVHNYSNSSDYFSSALSKSKATVKVFGNDKLLGYYLVPTENSGTFWEVFRIQNGQIIKVNEIKSTKP